MGEVQRAGPQPLYTHVSRLIRRWRRRAALSQRELAARIGTKQSVISRMESEDYEGHSLTMLDRIAQSVGVDVKISLEREGDPRAPFQGPRFGIDVPTLWPHLRPMGWRTEPSRWPLSSPIGGIESSDLAFEDPDARELEWTEELVETMADARRECEVIGTPYLIDDVVLMAMVRDEGGTVHTMLGALGLDPAALYADLAGSQNILRRTDLTGAGIAYSVQLRRAFELADAYARSMGDTAVDTPHLLLALLGEATDFYPRWAHPRYISAGMKTIAEQRDTLEWMIRARSSAFGVEREAMHRKENAVRHRSARTFPPPAEVYVAYGADRPLAATRATLDTLLRAHNSAAARFHEHVSTEHILLELLAQHQGLAAVILESLGTDRARLRAAAEAALGGAPRTSKNDALLPYSPNAITAMMIAGQEALAAHEADVGTGDMLLGLLGTKPSVAAALLAENGLTVEAVRALRARLSD